MEEGQRFLCGCEMRLIMIGDETEGFQWSRLSANDVLIKQANGQLAIQFLIFKMSSY